MIQVYITGTSASVRSSELIKPPIKTVPIEARSSAPSVSPSESGSMPNTIAHVVIKIGRKRVAAAERIASITGSPFRRC